MKKAVICSPEKVVELLLQPLHSLSIKPSSRPTIPNNNTPPTISEERVNNLSFAKETKANINISWYSRRGRKRGWGRGLSYALLISAALRLSERYAWSSASACSLEIG